MHADFVRPQLIVQKGVFGTKIDVVGRKPEQALALLLERQLRSDVGGLERQRDIDLGLVLNDLFAVALGLLLDRHLFGQFALLVLGEGRRLLSRGSCASGMRPIRAELGGSAEKPRNNCGERQAGRRAKAADRAGSSVLGALQPRSVRTTRVVRVPRKWRQNHQRSSRGPDARQTYRGASASSTPRRSRAGLARSRSLAHRLRAPATAPRGRGGAVHADPLARHPVVAAVREHRLVAQLATLRARREVLGGRLGESHARGHVEGGQRPLRIALAVLR